MGVPGPQHYQWVKSSQGNAPPNGVVGGYDKGEPIYVGRADHEGAVIPGKIHPSHRCCYVPWEGTEHAYRHYEVLCLNFGGQPNWQRASADQLPSGAMQGGHTADGEPLYIGRHMHEGDMVPGRVQKSKSCLFIPYGCNEHSYREFEVLVSDSPLAIELTFK